MKTLKTIQTLAKLGRVLSKIVFVCCVVGFCGCVIGITSVAAGAHVFIAMGTSLEDLLINEAGMTTGTIYASMAVGIVLCAGEAVLAAFAEHYFRRETQDGTPFTTDGANEMLRLGVLAIALPLAAQMLAEVVHLIIRTTMADVAPLNYDSYGSVGMGVMFILAALICRYGAERTNNDEGARLAPASPAETEDREAENNAHKAPAAEINPFDEGENNRNRDIINSDDMENRKD